MNKFPVPISVKGLIDVAKHCSNFFTAVDGVTESVVRVKKLKNCGVALNKTLLKWGKDLVLHKLIVHVFMYAALHDFTNRAKQRNGAII